MHTGLAQAGPVQTKLMENIIKFAEEVPETKPWPRIGTAFSTKSGVGLNIVIGNKIRKEGSEELVETVEEVNLRVGDSLFVTPLKGKDGGQVVTQKGAKMYRVLVKPREDEKVEESL